MGDGRTVRRLSRSFVFKGFEGRAEGADGED